MDKWSKYYKNGISREELKEIYNDGHSNGFASGLFIGITLSSAFLVALKLIL